MSADLRPSRAANATPDGGPHRPDREAELAEVERQHRSREAHRLRRLVDRRRASGVAPPR